jgi:hypothetical protein
MWMKLLDGQHLASHGGSARKGAWIRRTVLPAFILLICFGGLGYTIYRNWTLLSTYPWRINWTQLALSFVFFNLQLLSAVAGWSLIMARLAKWLPFRKHLKVYCYSNMAKHIPGFPWYIAGRAYWYRQEGVAASTTALGSILELTVVILTGSLMALLTGLVQVVSVSWADLRLLIGVVVLGLILIHPAVLSWALSHLGRREAPQLLTYWDTLAWSASYVGVWMASGCVLYTIISTFYPLSPQVLPEVLWAWSLSATVASLAFFSPGGLGIKEIALSLLLSRYIPAPLATVAAIAMRVGWTTYEALWGLISLKL